MSMLKFPDGFLWGAATSSYQVEGGIENNDWAEGARNGKVPTAGRACGHYTRYSDDFDRAVSLGHNAHRFSIEWARIEPEEGKFNREAVEHYQSVISSLRERNMVPFVTLWHFTLPQWLAKAGGVRNKKFPEYFSRYTAYVAEHLNLKGCYLITMNEPHVFSEIGWVRGAWPPFNHFNIAGWWGVMEKLVHAHILSYEAIKKLKPSLPVGVVEHGKYAPSNKNPINRGLSKLVEWYRNRWFLDRSKGRFDFIGLNYYRHRPFGVEDNFPKSDFGWSIFPEGIYHALLDVRRYDTPVYITENGLADAKDEMRAAFIKEHIYWMHRALSEGVRVKGYFHWSLLDNFEWSEGFNMRFGLVEVNFDTLERKIRSSAYEYKKICESNSLIIDE